jgi:hypothetical protein
MAPFTLRDLHLISGYLPDWLSVRRAFQILEMIAKLHPIFHLQQLQQQGTGQRGPTGWGNTIRSILSDTFAPETWGGGGLDVWEDDNNTPDINVETRQQLIAHAENILHLMEEDKALQVPSNIEKHLVTHPPKILLCPLQACIFEPCSANGITPTLHRESETRVRIIGPNYKEEYAYLVVSFCPKCDAHYYPHAITYFGGDHDLTGARRQRSQRLLPNPEWYMVSRSGFWVHQALALLQHGAIRDFKATWMGFLQFFNKTFHTREDIMNDDQVHRLYAEHFSRILLQAHGKLDVFVTTSFASGRQLIEDVLKIIGENGGIVPGGKMHTCPECTHTKRNSDGTMTADGQVTRAAVMDGKTLTHRVSSSIH